MTTPTITAHPCPSWCTQPAGHDFHALASGGLTREHTSAVLGSQVDIQLTLTDYAMSSAGPVLPGPVLVVLDTETRRPHHLTPGDLRHIAQDFAAAAALLEATTPNGEDTP